MPEQAQLAVGDVLDGKYRLEALIGSGGMGAVYRARHIDLDSTRAIKLMRPELAKDESFVHRFENEAHLAEGVRHPNVVALYDFATLPDGTKYIVWELVEGETLRDALERGVVFTHADVIRLVGEIGGGLAAAHNQGILHRDVSPDNIMLGDGESGTGRAAKLLDFGVAKATGSPQSLATTTGMVFGKIGYASPEQMGLLEGEESLDARSDVFSLAAVGYGMLTGKPPFVTSSMRSFLHDLMIAPESEHRARFAHALEDPWREPLTRALARNREERPGTMEAFVDEIRELARPPRAESTSHRMRELAFVIVTVVLLALATAYVLRVDISNVPLPPRVELEPRAIDFPYDDLDPWSVPAEETPPDEPEPVDSPDALPTQPTGEDIDEGAESDTEPRVAFFTPDREPERASPVPEETFAPETKSPPPPEEKSETAEPAPEPSELDEPNDHPRVAGGGDEQGGIGTPPEPVWVAPRRVKKVEPVYPERAKRRAAEGTVILEIVIAPSGDVTDVRLVEGVDRDLDRAAEEAVRQWKYAPRDDSVTIEVKVGFSWTS